MINLEEHVIAHLKLTWECIYSHLMVALTIKLALLLTISQTDFYIERFF